MNAIQNFAFEDHLVRTVERDGAPWFVGKDVCDCLDLKNYRSSLDLLDDDEKGVHTMDTLGGNQTMIVVSEAGVYRLVFRSRKAEAERFKRWLAHEVLPQIRRTGAYGAPRIEAVAVDVDAPLAARVDAVRLAARLFGRERARALWARIGLPAVPPPLETEAAGDARACLRTLLEHQPGADGRTVRALILDAVDDDAEAELLLRSCGIRLAEEGEAFLVANVSPALEAVFKGTEWGKRRWRIALRRLRGANPHGTTRFSVHGRQTRATLLPVDLIDELSS